MNISNKSWHTFIISFKYIYRHSFSHHYSKCNHLHKGTDTSPHCCYKSDYTHRCHCYIHRDLTKININFKMYYIKGAMYHIGYYWTQGEDSCYLGRRARIFSTLVQTEATLCNMSLDILNCYLRETRG